MVTYNWGTTGTQALTVTATNKNGLATNTHVIAIGVPLLTITKSGPVTATANTPITYTLTVTNRGVITATDLVVTDTIPSGATYITGGVKIGPVVSWMIPELAANDGVMQTTFVVMAEQSITNSDYSVWSEGGYSAQGDGAIVTLINPEEITEEQNVFLPVLIKE